MEKYDFTMHHLYGENHYHITKILSILQATSVKEIFVRKFYATIPMLNLSEEEYNLYGELAEHAFDFLQKYNDTHTKIKIYRGTAKNVEADHTIIEILSKDIPFLFDSTMCLLNRSGIAVDRVAHPTIFVRRDSNGKLLTIDESLKENGNQEIIVQIRTVHAIDNKLVYEIEEELKAILALVTYAVTDWKNIVALLHSYISQFMQQTIVEDDELHQEQKEFLERMQDNYFIFLGSIQYSFNQQNRNLINDSILGIGKLELDKLEPLIDSTIFGKNFFEEPKQIISIGKLNISSVIHRETNLDYLCLKIFNEQGNLEKAIVFIGLFTSILYYQSATLIPIIRGKLREVLLKAGFAPHSYSGKELVSIVEALPRDELFQISADELFPLVMEVYALLFKPELRLFLRKRGDTISCLLFLPIELANVDNIRKLKAALAFEYGPIVNHHFSQVNNTKLCYYYFTIDSRKSDTNIANLAQVEQELRSITRPWENSLNDLLLKEYGKTKGREKFLEFSEAFPIAYKEDNIYSSVIIRDIENISSVIERKKVIFEVVPIVEGKNNVGQFKIYHLEEINLSSIMPMLQNMGFNVAAEQIYVVKPYSNNGEVCLHQFILKLDEKEQKMLIAAKQNIEEAFYAMWDEKCQNDSYNQLILKANLSYRQVTLIIALTAYLGQIKIGYSKEYIEQILNKHFEITKQLVSLFYNMFDVKLNQDERQQNINKIRNAIEELLKDIHDNIEDQVIRRFINLIEQILRTNYFLIDQDGKSKDFISFKINTAGIVAMPLPCPYREIFVYSAGFEAIHLRGGKVARGGIRWSDRSEDYRTEVLGLMKTQIVKNSVIIPTGAKGGFILKNINGLDREALHAKAVECYKNFLRGMLDITDNILMGKLHHPKHVVRLDENDSYLVVAADKGTATFSDTANQISAEYNFWLGDAFASGGSKGYDHKKMAITARGAWISVVRHFYEMGINIANTEFTVVGIGDMSGDVFGNGMLLSDNIKLVGAFNHMHIFIDPNPDSKKSFAERKRLFDLPRSTWLDYSPEVLSKGGQIYNRKAKLLQLTPEIRELLKLNVDKITPDELIKILLTAPVDLLWNGGIGTYVKASFETNEQVGDKTNDNLRCNGVDLKCKIVGEGGNLGFTQYGRIEYARAGGKINTDAIDNSAGVDCSDHEVNIKIILNQAITKGLLTEEERINLLESMTEEVAELVLKDNRTQTRALSISEQQGTDIMGAQEHFVNALEEQGILDRKLECLPTKQQFNQLQINKQGLTRPELSVLLAYSKNAIYNKLIETNIPEDKYFYSDLLAYFPEAMRKKFADLIAEHPLRREIITNAITNSMVNRIYTFYLHLTVESTGHKFCDVARAYTITRDAFGLRTLWQEMSSLDGMVSVQDQVKLYIMIKKFMVRSTSWLLRNHRGKMDIALVIEEYQQKISDLSQNIDGYLIGKFKENYEANLKEFVKLKVPYEMARRVAILGPLSYAYSIIDVSNKYKASVEQVARIHFELGQRFSIDWLRYCANNIVVENNWQKLAVRGFKDELADIHRKITASAIEYIGKPEGSLEKWYKHNNKYIKLFDKFILEVRSQISIEYAMVDLSLKKLSILLTK